MKEFKFEAKVEWTGNDGRGTSVKSYGRDSEVSSPGKPTIIGSAPKDFGGDGANWSPEDFLVAAVAQCHMLTFLFVAAREGIVVEEYVDRATGTLEVSGATEGQFAKVVLRPTVTISAGDHERVGALHEAAHAGCYVGRSVRCAVEIEPTTFVSHT